MGNASSRRLTILLSVLLAVIVIGGSLAAVAVGHKLAAHAGVPGHPTAGGDGAGDSGDDSGSATDNDADGEPGESVTDDGSAGTTSPGNGPGEGDGTGATDGTDGSGASESDGNDDSSDGSAVVQPVFSASAQGSPYAPEVERLLARYFTAINKLDYDAWLTTVSTAQAKRDRDGWTHDYSTTHDSDIYVSDIDDGISDGEPMTVRLQFTSHQDIEFAPTALPETCVRWDVTYYLVDEGLGLRVGTSAQEPAMASCPS